MRYDKPIYFQKLAPDRYDPATGNYIENEPTEVQKYADVTDAGVNTLQIIFGSVKEGAKVVRLQQPYIQPFDYIRIADRRYRVGFSRGNKVFVCREVQG